jgi:hypothetical protein
MAGNDDERLRATLDRVVKLHNAVAVIKADGTELFTFGLSSTTGGVFGALAAAGIDVEARAWRDVLRRTAPDRVLTHTAGAQRLEVAVDACEAKQRSDEDELRLKARAAELSAEIEKAKKEMVRPSSTLCVMRVA